MSHSDPSVRPTVVGNISNIFSIGRKHGRVPAAGLEFCSFILVLLGSTVLYGWFSRNLALVSVLPGHVSMKFNTALSFLIAGITLHLAQSQASFAKLWSRFLAFAVFSLGLLTVLEYSFRIDLHMDQVFIPDPLQRIYPGRMAYISAIMFCLAGSSLFLLTGNKLWRNFSQGLALFLTSIALASIVGYAYGVPVLYGSLSNVNTMALHTGFGFLVLGFGIIVGDEHSTIGGLLAETGTAGLLTRRLFPLILVVPILLGYFYLRPAINFGELRFGMALFAVTLVLTGALALVLVAAFLSRLDRQSREIEQVALESAAIIKLSERELRLVTDNLPILISYINMDSKFLRVNKTYEDWHGKPSAAIVGRTIEELLGSDYWERTRSAREAAAEGVTTSVETQYPTAKGERCAVVTYAPDRDEQGHIRGYACMVLDVDAQRQAEAAARQNEKLAAIGRLSSSIAHEINNPVDAVIGILYIARQQSENLEVKALLETADSELKRVAHIAGQTLSFHKQSDRMEFVKAADLFASVLVLHRVRLGSNRIAVERRDRTTEPFECFEGQIRQVLNNLVANAVDAMQLGGKLLLRSRPTREWSTGRRGVAITVADTGSGMSQEVRSRVLKPFFTTKGIGGTGLGLWITDEILIRHGGSMRLRSSVRDQGHGSVFTIFLPLRAQIPGLD